MNMYCGHNGLRRIRRPRNTSCRRKSCIRRIPCRSHLIHTRNRSGSSGRTLHSTYRSIRRCRRILPMRTCCERNSLRRMWWPKYNNRYPQSCTLRSSSFSCCHTRNPHYKNHSSRQSHIRRLRNSSRWKSMRYGGSIHPRIDPHRCSSRRRISCSRRNMWSMSQPRCTPRHRRIRTSSWCMNIRCHS